MCNMTWHGVGEFLNSISTIVIAAFSILMYVVVKGQWRTTEIIERAWVVPNPSSPAPYQTGASALFSITWINKGKTPAWVTAMGSRAMLVKSESDLPKEPSYDMAGPFTAEGNPLAPGGMTENPFPVDANRLASLEQRTVLLYIFGMTEYRDIFGENTKLNTAICFNPLLMER